jgi:hypothetical protein
LKSDKISLLSKSNTKSAKGAMKYNFFMCDTISPPFFISHYYHCLCCLSNIKTISDLSFFQSSFFFFLINASKSHKNLYRNQFFLIHLQPYFFDIIFLCVYTFESTTAWSRWGWEEGSEVQWGKYNEKLFDKISFRW